MFKTLKYTLINISYFINNLQGVVLDTFLAIFLTYFVIFYHIFCFRELTEHDVTALYHELANAYHSSDSEVDVEEDINKPSTSSRSTRPTRSAASRTINEQTANKDWRIACRQLLDTLWQCEDSIPFRYE